jgi:hypothetical protein
LEKVKLEVIVNNQRDLQRFLLHIVRRVLRHRRATGQLEQLVLAIANEEATSPDAMTQDQLKSRIVRRICNLLATGRHSSSIDAACHEGTLNLQLATVRQ